MNQNKELQERCAERVLAETNVDSINYSAIDIIIQETKDSMGTKAEPVDVEKLAKILMDGYIDIQDGIQSVDGVTKIILSQSPHQAKE